MMKTNILCLVLLLPILTSAQEFVSHYQNRCAKCQLDEPGYHLNFSDHYCQGQHETDLPGLHIWLRPNRKVMKKVALANASKVTVTANPERFQLTVERRVNRRPNSSVSGHFAFFASNRLQVPNELHLEILNRKGDFFALVPHLSPSGVDDLDLLYMPAGKYVLNFYLSNSKTLVQSYLLNLYR